MTKLKIYIDFEAISAPFNWEMNIRREFPYAYSLGVWSGKKFKTKTFIFNFTQDHTDDIDQILRKNIIKDVRALTGNNSFMLNAKSAQFVSFAPALEKNVLSSVYKGVEVVDISKGAQISLEQATEKWVGKKSYFPTLGAYVAKNLTPEFIAKRGMDRDGALAAYAGYLLYSSALNQNAKMYFEGLNIRELIKELVEYSDDDVVRMRYIEENFAEFKENADKRRGALIKRSKLISRERRLSSMVRALQTYDKSLTLEDTIKQIEKEAIELEKEAREIEI